MMVQISRRKSVKVLLYTIFATLLITGPILLSPLPGSDGTVWARDLVGGRAAGGGEKRARPQRQSASKIDRKPRASSADRGSMRRASAERPRTKLQAKPKAKLKAQQRASADRPKAQRPKPDRSAGNQPFARKEASRSPQKMASADRQVKRENLKSKGSDQQQNTARQRRTERDMQVKEGRKQYAENQEDIRKQRKEAMEELQQNKFDHRDDAREDRQDHMDDARKDRQDFQEDMADERRDLYEDIYDDRRYWGNDNDYWDDDDDDDNNGWLWGIAGAAAGGLAGYAIGAAVNEPPEGTVAVPVAGVPYQYYGGAFYEPAPSGAGYVTTPAPVGAQVEAPPIDCTVVFGPEDEGYCYFQGAFFIYDDSANQYVVVEPPAGTSVTYLPPGYEEVSIEGSKYMKLGGTYYRPYYEDDEVVYVVSEV